MAENAPMPTTRDPRADALLIAIEAYVPSGREEEESLAAIRAFLRDAADPLSRAASTSHVTGSAVVVRRDTRAGAFLLIHHRKLDRWLQPGGHVDPEDASVLDTAQREAREETGAADIEPVPGEGILGVDVHPIPARHGKPGHIHYDVQYLFFSDAEAGRGQPEEVRGVAWFTLDQALATGVDGSLERSLRKAERWMKGRAGG
jgi:8-oxo-dGTP pyrophosphatase MutT (NUDIX family)